MMSRKLVDRNKVHGVICYKIKIVIHKQKPHVLFPYYQVKGKIRNGMSSGRIGKAGTNRGPEL